MGDPQCHKCRLMKASKVFGRIVKGMMHKWVGLQMDAPMSNECRNNQEWGEATEIRAGIIAEHQSKSDVTRDERAVRALPNS